MNASDLKLNTLYKLNLSNAPINTLFLADSQTVVTIVGTDGSSSLDLPFQMTDYLILEFGASSDEIVLTYDNVDDVTGLITNATYILYYITTLNISDCTVLAQYSEECHIGNVIKISRTDYNTIFNAYPNSATISTGATATYDPMSIYLIKRYRHNINLYCESDQKALGSDFVSFSFINDKSTAYSGSTIDGFNNLVSDLIACGFTNQYTICPAVGQVSLGLGKTLGIYGTYNSTSGYSIDAKCIRLYTPGSTVGTFSQKVNTLISSLIKYDTAASWLTDIVEEI